MGIYSVKPAFQRRLAGLRDVFIRMGIKADAITLAALVLSLAGAAALAFSAAVPWLLILVPVAAIGRIALNALDGMVAIATGTARPFGEVFNEFCDRLSDVAWFGGLAFVVDTGLSLAALVAVLLSSYVGTVTKAAGGERIYAGVMGKADRMILLSAGAVAAFFVGHELLTYFAWLVLGGSIVTVAQRIAIAHRNLGRR